MADAPDPRARFSWVHPLTTIFPWVVLLTLFLYFFSAFSSVLLGLLAACIVAATLRPLLRFVPGPRGLAAIVLGLATVGLLGALIYASSYPLADPIKRRIEDWPKIQQQTNQFLHTWQLRLGMADQSVTLSDLLRRLGTFLVGEGGQRLFSQSADLALGLFLTFALICFGSIFFLATPPDELIADGLRALPARYRSAARATLADLAPRFRRWVLGTLAGMAIVFTASFTGYTIIGLEAALPLALLAGIAEVVPTVGPAVSCVIATLFAAATEGWPKALGVLVVYGIIEGAEAYFILPMIMRGAVRIHPAVTLFSVVLWGKIFGVPGLILAIPINLTLWCAIEHFIIAPRPCAAEDAWPAAEPKEERK